MANLKKYKAEFIGTFVLVFMGCGSAVFYGDVLTVAFAFGLSIVAMAYVIGNISGCHINPAVSLAMLINKKISAKDFVGYVLSQIAGALAGAALLTGVSELYGVDATGNMGSNVATWIGIPGALIVELVLTFIFVLTILGVTSDEKKSNIAGIIIGLTLTFVHIVGIPLTGTSVNPARSIGPAVFAAIFGDLEPLIDLWVFIVAPLAGAALATFAYKFLNSEKTVDISENK